MKISVAMTTYNGEKYLDQQIQSILNQTLAPDEIIVCDDGSTDSTVTILKRYSDQKKLIYYVNDRQLGLIDNFKKAVSLAKKTNCIALSDQDDEWLPDKLCKSAALMESIDNMLPGMVHTDLMLVDSNQILLNRSFRNELGQDKYQHNLQTLLFGNFVTGCTILMNPLLREFFVTMPNDLLFHDAWIALIAFTFGEVKESREALIKYRKHNNNLSIAANTKPRNRYRSTIKQILTALNGKDDFLSEQINLIARFYEQHSDQMPIGKQRYFSQFLELKNKPYLYKKLAFRSMVNRFRL